MTQRSVLLTLCSVSMIIVSAQEPVKNESIKLSLFDAVQTSLKNNLQVGIAKNIRSAAKANELVQEGAFDINFVASDNYSKTQSASISNSTIQSSPSTLITTETNSTRKSRSLTASLSKAFIWGGTFQASYLGPNYNSSIVSGTQTITPISGSPITSPFGPLPASPFPYTGSFSASYTQSLLKGFGPNSAAASYLVSQNNSIASDYTFQQSIISLVSSTENLYWDLVFATRNFQNKKASLKLAQAQLKESKIRVEVGILAPIEVTSAEAQVALREQDIITAEAQYLNATDALYRALYPNIQDRPSGIEPADEPTIEPLTGNPTSAIDLALGNRVELKVAELDLKSKEILKSSASNRMLPQLDVSVGINENAATRSTPALVREDLTGKRYPGYNFGVTFSIPLLNRVGRGSSAVANAQYRQSELNVQDLKLSIRLQVEQAFRNVDAASRGVNAAQKTRLFTQQDFEAEQKKFQNGMSTNFLVQSKQNILDTSIANELQAQINYAKARTALEQAQGTLLQARGLEIK